MIAAGFCQQASTDGTDFQLDDTLGNIVGKGLIAFSLVCFMHEVSPCASCQR